MVGLVVGFSQFNPLNVKNFWQMVSFPFGCGSKIGTQNGTLVNGNNDKPVVLWFNFDPCPFGSLASFLSV